MRGTKDPPSGPSRVLELHHGLAEIAERSGWVVVERPRVKRPHLDQQIIEPFYHAYAAAREAMYASTASTMHAHLSTGARPRLLIW